jgi:hypothetical protein
LIIDTAGLIRSGQTAYDTGTGWWIGNDGGTPKFSIGNPSGEWMKWTGTQLLTNTSLRLIETGTFTNDFNISSLDGDTDETYIVKIQGYGSSAWGMRMKFNNDSGSNFFYATHYIGRSAGASTHDMAQYISQPQILLFYSSYTAKSNQIEIRIRAKSGTARIVDYSVSSFTDTNNFYNQTGIGGWTNTSSNLTQINFDLSLSITAGRYWIYTQQR